MTRPPARRFTVAVHLAAHVEFELNEGISKTINLPVSATPDTFSSAFLEAWRLGMKAISVYRDGSAAKPA
ncbi:MAG: hypothetical protein O7H41_17140 [Planctomycetota bacterium]|nr:hypothetical protein [Planctomycetota bacterium]